METNIYEYYRLAKKSINVIYLLEQHTNKEQCSCTMDIIDKLLEIFYIYDKNDTEVKYSNEISVCCIDETSNICKRNTSCSDCAMSNVQSAISSINLMYDDKIRISNLNLIDNCSVIYLLMNYKFRPKINTDDWEIIY